MLYTALAWSSRRAMRWCYRDVTVAGEVPGVGPVLLAVNHPNDLPDICAILGYMRRHVHFVANVTAAEQPLVSWAYARMGVVPVHRVRDARRAMARGENSAEANDRAFARVCELLARGACVCVFPEGGVQRGPHLGPLRTGLARMALDARDAGGVRGIRIVPVGLTYEAPLVYRSRVLIHVGSPIELDTWTPDEGRRAESQLTVEIGAALRSVTRNAPDDASGRALGAVALVAATLAPDVVPHVAPDSALAAGAAVWRSLSRGIYGPGIAPQAGADPRVVPAAALVRHLSSLPGAESPVLLLRAWSDAMRRPRGARESRAARGSSVALLAATCAALPGLMTHAPAWGVVRWFARATAPTAEEVIPRTIIPGLYLMATWYLIVALGLWAALMRAGMGGWPSLGTSLLLICIAPTLGDLAMRWLDRIADRRRLRLLAREMPELAACVTQAVDAIHAPLSEPATAATAFPAHHEREVI